MDYEMLTFRGDGSNIAKPSTEEADRRPGPGWSRT